LSGRSIFTVPPTKPYPILSYGSSGDAVVLLQKALNLALTNLNRLEDDGSFGPLTHGRVVEFQGQRKAVRDGVVGPATWAELDSFVKEVLKSIDQNLGASPDEDVQRQRIVDIAEASFANWGWGAGGAVTPDGSQRIAAARGFGPSIAGRRARQGGTTLASIYAMAQVGGLAAPNCLSITSEMENVYQQDANDTSRRDKINNDIGSWCGIFATYCYRAAGLKVSWEQVRTQSTTHFTSLRSGEAVRKGDIGVMTPGLNHHFVVVEDAEPGQRVYSIDGNVGNPSEMTVSPWNSVISKRFYLRNTLASKSAKFLRPKFAAFK
jgi:hypothetical protein